MDPIKALDMEHRSGISQAEVDDFANRMDLISKAMKDIQSGTFDPHNCNIPGYKTLEQEEAERKERARREQERLKREEERKRKAKQEEHDTWWSRAKLRFSLDESEEEGEAEEDAETRRKSKSAQWANRVLAAYKARDANDYSLWDQWAPEDPVSLQEQAEREAELDKLRNREFEINNPDFCDQFKKDMEERQRSQEEKARTAERLKQQGNRSYKKKQYEHAIKMYMQALEATPFNVAVLANIAQCYLRLELLDDSIEFSSRVLYIDPKHVKALSRRATAWHKQKKWKEAAEDMSKAIQLDGENPDVAEQHSIIVGDYEDAIANRELEAALELKGKRSPADAVETTTRSPLSASCIEELRFSMELLKKMEEHPAVANTEPHDDTQHISDAWVAYDLLLPFLERNEHVRARFRTSGEMNKLCDRIAYALEAARECSEDSKDRHQQEAVVTSAMINCAAAAVADTPRNQVVMFRHAAFRTQILGAFGALGGVGTSEDAASGTAWIVQASLAHFVEEVISSKGWRTAVLTSKGALTALLSLLCLQADGKSAAREELASKPAIALAVSSICFTLSSEAAGIQAFAGRADDCLAVISQALEIHDRIQAVGTLNNLLGLVTNLSTSATIRGAIEHDSCKEIRRNLVQALLRIAQDGYCKSPSALSASPSARTCSERALGVLLNFSFAENSPVRTNDLLDFAVVDTAERILTHAEPSTFEDSILVLSRTVSLLCRLHSVFRDDKSQNGYHVVTYERLSSLELLSQLYGLCEWANTNFGGSGKAVSDELWQLCGQIWCHLGWCAHLPHVRTFLREKNAVPLLIQAIELANAQKAYRRPSGETTACERLVGNIVKVLIAMQADHDAVDAQGFREKKHLVVLVNALQTLSDGLARKNVAILLAKLCQSDKVAKDVVRELRGIEMMLTISKAIKQPPVGQTARKAVLGA